ncbi:MAG TPA: IPT/TIG domain-containing protein [Capillimicrobium sp.]|nr:IPT/TIG domain-containing protein [Capillimicrobium sp.]
MRARTLAWLAAAVVALAAAPTTASAATAYVITCSCEDHVTVVDSASRSIVAKVPVGDMPSALAVSPDGRAAYVANLLDGTISVIDGASHAITRTIALAPGDEPYGVAVSPDGATLYVLLADAAADTYLATVDAASGATTGRTPQPVIASQATLVISPDGRALYTNPQFGGQVVWIDLTQPGFPGTDITPAAAVGPSGVAVAPDGTLWVADLGEQVFHLAADGTPIGAAIPVNPGNGDPFGIALDATGAHAWISGTPLTGGGTQLTTATGTTQTTTGVPTRTLAVAVSPDGDGVFLGAVVDPELYVVDPQTRALTATIALDGDPDQIVVGRTPVAPTRPVVTAVSPAEGPLSGGTEVRIEGANFATGARVLFGDTPATTQRVLGFNAIVATAPPAAALGRVRVSVVAPSGLRSTDDAGFRYELLPAPALAPAAPGPGGEPAGRPRCVVPDVRGLRLRGARKRLRAANCTVGTVSRIRGRRHQRVVRQSVGPGAERPGGWGVALAIRPRPAR